MSREAQDRIAVVALGGNAISPPNQENTIHNQFRQTRSSMDGIISVLKRGYRLAITHGNGPQVGNALLRVELSRGQVPELPLGILVAETQGFMGYMIEQSLINRLHDEKMDNQVISVITQILVNRDDPSLKEPSKFIGQTYTKEEALELASRFKWVVKEDKARNGYRRVVGSPIPIRMLNHNAIRTLVEQDWIVICAGGGGIPVYTERDGSLEGVDAVVDKDRASAVLGAGIGASELFILTEVPKVSLHFNTPEQVDLDHISVKEAERYMVEGHFPKGSMGPKIESALYFIEHGGKRVIITNLENIVHSIDGDGGTVIE